MGAGACGKDQGFTAQSSFDTPDAGFGEVGPPVVGLPGFEGGASGLLGAGCANATAQAKRVPVYMLIVLDGSGSMVNANKWAAIVPALDAIFDDFEVRGDPAFGVGLTIFADANDPTITEKTAGPYDKMDVPVAFVDQAQHAALHARIDLTTPNLGTPTYEVLSGQYPLLEQLAPKPPLLADGKRVLVLMTDGVPDPDMPAGQNEGPWSLKLAQTEFMKAAPGPITTFAVGIGPLDGTQTDYDPAFMGALAVAGGAPKQPCDPTEKTNPLNMCHFQITPGGQTVDQLKEKFIEALTAIRTELLTCEYTLDKTGGVVDPTEVNVIYTSGAGTQSLLEEDPANGWTYDDPNAPTKVVLHGTTCDTVKADEYGNIEIVLGCKTITK